MIVVFFSLCWTPVLLIDIVDTILGRWTFPREAYVAYTFLANISSALNPLIYGVLNKNFRNDYIKVLSCRYCCSQAAVEPNAGLSGSANVLEIKPLRVPNVERKPGLLTKNKRRFAAYIRVSSLGQVPLRTRVTLFAPWLLSFFHVNFLSTRNGRVANHCNIQALSKEKCP